MTASSATLPQYKLPTRGILSKVPSSWVPYGELMRIDKPTGIYLFYFPHFLGTLYAASLMKPKPSVSALLALNVYLFISNIFLRGAACALNDNMDREYDRKVARCRLRPIARGAISPLQAHIFTGFLSAITASFLILLPPDCVYIAGPSIVLLVLYPFAKCFTDYPQVVLGFHISTGIFMGSAAMGLNPLPSLEDNDGGFLTSIAALYAANIIWTIIYDTIYAHQDIKDDAKAGVKSMAVTLGDRTKPLLFILALLQVALLIGAGVATGMHTLSYFAVTCVGTLITLMYMIWSVDLRRPDECWWWFRNGFWFTGGAMAGGFLAEYLFR